MEEIKKWHRKVLFTVEMLRNGDRESHSYIIGVYSDEFSALKEAWLHMRHRGQKYDAVVTGWELNGGNNVYSRELGAYSWDAFAESCKDMAEKLKPILDKEFEQQERKGEK